MSTIPLATLFLSSHSRTRLVLVSLYPYANTKGAIKNESSSIQGDEFQTSFELGADMDMVSLVRPMNGQTHFYDIVIFDHEGRRQFQFMEGIISGEAHLATSSYSTDMTLSQETFKASTFICSSEISCWTINCSLRKYLKI